MDDKCKLFNYKILHKPSNGLKIEIVKIKKYQNHSKIIDASIITQNLLGLNKKEFFSNKRLEYIIKFLKTSNYDIICLQEVSNEFLKEIKKISKFKKYYFSLNKIEKNRNLDVSTIIISKFKPKFFKSFNLGGISDYNNSFTIAEYDNLVIVNLYVQAGCKDSPYLENYYKTFQKCRLYNFKAIKKYIYKTYLEKSKKNIIFTGDFNCDLNGKYIDWPELSILNSYKFKLKLNNFNPLLTEDTTKNLFRYNIKQKEKHKQYDGFLFKGNIIFSKPKIINDKPIFFLRYQNELIFQNELLKKFKNLKLKTINNMIPIFLSDHFGIKTKIKILK